MPPTYIHGLPIEEGHDNQRHGASGPVRGSRRPEKQALVFSKTAALPVNCWGRDHGGCSTLGPDCFWGPLSNATLFNVEALTAASKTKTRAEATSATRMSELGEVEKTCCCATREPLSA